MSCVLLDDKGSREEEGEEEEEEKDEEEDYDDDLRHRYLNLVRAAAPGESETVCEGWPRTA